MKLKSVAFCGCVVAILLGNCFVALQLMRGTQIDDAVIYENHFVPHNSASNARHHRRRDTGSDPRKLKAHDHAVANSLSRFPIRRHIVTQGEARTATTLLFNMVGVSYFLYLVENDPEQIPDVQLLYYQRHDGRKIMRKSKSPHIFKTHSELRYYLSEMAVVFAAAEDREEAAEMRETLERDGHTVAFVQDMETLKEDGLAPLVDVYVAGYGLSEKYRASLNDYFSKWEILRQCCGKQMSSKWRNDMMPEKYKLRSIKSHPTCQEHIRLCHQVAIQTREGRSKAGGSLSISTQRHERERAHETNVESTNRRKEGVAEGSLGSTRRWKDIQ